MAKIVNVAFLGCGNIGSGVWDLIIESRDRLLETAGLDIRVKYVLARFLRQPDHGPVPPEMIVDSIEPILNDPDVSIVMEFMGGEHPAADFQLACLNAGKTVITANKLALSLHWDELMQAAAEHNTGIFYEASVCGAVPAIQALQSSFWGNRIEWLEGILNGTTNSMLCDMTDQRLPYEEALVLAQAAGLAEPDPTYDVDGLDAACKLSILGRLAFHRAFNPMEIPTEGIRHIVPADIACAEKMGRRLKLVAHASRNGQPWVGPAFVPANGQLGIVNNANNGLLVHGSACEDMFFGGKGAGRMPTGGALLNDLVRAALGDKPYFPPRENYILSDTKREESCPRYVRVVFSAPTDAVQVLADNGIRSVKLGQTEGTIMLATDSVTVSQIKTALKTASGTVLLIAAVPGLDLNDLRQR